MALVEGVSEPVLLERRQGGETNDASLAIVNGLVDHTQRIPAMKAALRVHEPPAYTGYGKDVGGGTGAECRREGREEEGERIVGKKTPNANGTGGRRGDASVTDSGTLTPVNGTESSCIKDPLGSKMADGSNVLEGTEFVGNGDAGVEVSEHFPESGSAEYEYLIESVIQCLEWKVNKGDLTEEALELLRLVPQGYIPLPHQVGGHRHVDGKLGFLRKVGHPELLFKPVQPGSKGPREVMFYESLFGDVAKFEELPEDVQRLKDLVPRYLGNTKIQDRAGHIHDFMMLEDITCKFRRPCILDVKIGRRVWDDFAESDKIERERKKYPAQEVIGWRIIGMRIYSPESDEYIYYDKFFGRSVTEHSALEAISHFFTDGSQQSLNHLIHPILDKLQVFATWFTTQTSLKLFATSLLIVYEGDTSQSIPPEELLDIRLVDFAHTYERDADESGLDENALFGLRNFILFLRRLLDQ